MPGALAFPPFRLDVADERLWRGSETIELRRKAFAVLRYLAEHPQRLVTQEELVKAVWGDVVVSDGALRTQIHELRRQLGEGIIETVVGRGYRFLPAIVAAAPGLAPEAEGRGAQAAQGASGPTPGAVSSPGPGPGPASRSASGPGFGSGTLRPGTLPLPPVGREEELALLDGLLERARSGERQLVFLTGAPGIGKTALATAFAEGAVAARRARAGKGQCVELYGQGEPCLPFLEALRQLCDSPRGERVVDVLARRAPGWLLQLPGIVRDPQLDALRQRAQGLSPMGMLRELAEALELLSAEEPLLLTLEDLQWSDHATVDALSMLGQRREPARLMCVATSRRAEVLAPSHPLNRVMRELAARRQATVVVLGPLREPDVRRYVDARFAAHDLPPALTGVIHGFTGGTPLFMVAVLEELVEKNVLRRSHERWVLDVPLEEMAARRPESVGQLIDIQIDRLGPTEQRVVEAGSVAGTEFAVGLVAAALQVSFEEVDSVCDGLARRGQFVRRAGSEEWPDGTVHARYAFLHDVYQDVCAERSAPARRQHWHRLMAERLEAAYAGNTTEIAHSLAVHYEKGNLPARAVPFYAEAGERAAARFAGGGGVLLFRRGLDLTRRLPASPSRDLLELRLLAGMAPLVFRATGHRNPELGAIYERAIALARAAGDRPRVGSALSGLIAHHVSRAEFDRGEQRVAELDRFAAEEQDPDLRVLAGVFRGNLALFRGELPSARALLEGAESLRAASHPAAMSPGDSTVVSSALLALTLWLLGHPGRALAAIDKGLARAHARGDPYMLAWAWVGLARVRFWRRDPPGAVQAAAQKALELDDKNSRDWPWTREATLFDGWARTATEARAPAAIVDEMGEHFAARVAAWPVNMTSLTAVMVDACRRVGRRDRALDLVAAARRFADERGERHLEAELLRLQGDLVRESGAGDPLPLLREAVAAAQARGARSLELRAALSLLRATAGTAAEGEARALLRAARGALGDGEGEPTPDLRDAQAALDR